MLKFIIPEQKNLDLLKDVKEILRKNKYDFSIKKIMQHYDSRSYCIVRNSMHFLLKFSYQSKVEEMRIVEVCNRVYEIAYEFSGPCEKNVSPY